mmetsp:Transcript_30913/g.78272  ORF Transcript_30913/g.78272 Transcript_30913/m.78272 type:complete len:563 (+) Transcript_30913:75-1763(+)
MSWLDMVETAEDASRGGPSPFHDEGSTSLTMSGEIGPEDIMSSASPQAEAGWHPVQHQHSSGQQQQQSVGTAASEGDLSLPTHLRRTGSGCGDFGSRVVRKVSGPSSNVGGSEPSPANSWTPELEAKLRQRLLRCEGGSRCALNITSPVRGAASTASGTASAVGGDNSVESSADGSSDRISGCASGAGTRAAWAGPPPRAVGLWRPPTPLLHETASRIPSPQIRRATTPVRQQKTTYRSVTPPRSPTPPAATPLRTVTPPRTSSLVGRTGSTTPSRAPPAVQQPPLRQPRHVLETQVAQLAERLSAVEKSLSSLGVELPHVPSQQPIVSADAVATAAAFGYAAEAQKSLEQAVASSLAIFEERIQAELEELGAALRRQAAEKADIGSITRMSALIQRLSQSVCQNEKALQEVHGQVVPSIVCIREQVAKASHAMRSMQDCVLGKVDKHLFDELAAAKDALADDMNLTEGKLMHELSLKLDKQEFYQRENEFNSQEFMDMSNALQALRASVDTKADMGDMAARFSGLDAAVEQRPSYIEVHDVVMKCLANARRVSNRHGPPLV